MSKLLAMGEKEIIDLTVCFVCVCVCVFSLVSFSCISVKFYMNIH